MNDAGAKLRLQVPFTEKPDIELKKVGLELVVRVSNHKRNIMLPAALASYRPRGAKLDAGTLTVTFERPENGAGDDRRARATARDAV